MNVTLGAVFIALAATAPGLLAQRATATGQLTEFKTLTLEELLEVKVTSVSRREEPASHAAAAVEVITSQQIERTGAASVQDALRFVPGLQVSAFNGHSYAISARGFTSLAANKLQVMQDGRSLYSPLFSGVFWDAYGAMLEDIDRIEVIRGPGATMWGANAVNGVINIITKDARDTQGGLLAAGGGTEERAFATARYGGAIGEKTYFRVYGRFQNRDSMALTNGSQSGVTPTEQQGGFRVDTEPDATTHGTLQGDYFYDETEGTPGEMNSNRSMNLLGRWTRRLGPGDLQLQAYFDRFTRVVPHQMGDHRNTTDLDVQYHGKLGARHDLVVGGDYRSSSDNTAGGGTTQFDPASRTTELASAFVQDEIEVLPSRLSVVLGSKFQWDSLGGFEPQPNVRAVWTPDERNTVWAAISRAVRMPTRIDEDLRFVPVPSTGVVLIRGNPDFRPEKLNAYELGYRVRATEQLFIDVTGFANVYDDLRSLEPTPPLGIPLVQFNRLDADTRGVELAVKFEATKWWHLSGSFSYLRRKLEPDADSHDPNRGTLEGNDAAHLYTLWSSMDVGRNVLLDLMLRRVGDLPAPAIPGYTELDARIAWRPADNWELSIVGQNLLHRQHLEFGTPGPTAAEVERGVYAKVLLRF